MTIDGFPPDAPHFFTNVYFDLIPEIDYLLLEEISQLTRKNNTSEKLTDLREAIIKLSWAKLSLIRARSAEAELISQFTEPGVIVLDYVLQIEHEKNIFEFVTNVKSALDGISTFLNTYFDLNENGGNSDIKKIKFKAKLIEADSSFKEFLDQFNIWLQENRGKSDSIVSLRDYWIHQSAPWIISLCPPNNLGALPIPKKLRKIDSPKNHTSENDLTTDNFWTTDEFLNYHYNLIVKMFLGVAKICIKKERVSQPDLEIIRTEKKTCFFPMRPTSNKEYTGMRLGRVSLQFV